MSRSHGLALIFVNATAAASSFVGSWLLADQIPSFPMPMLIVFGGILGCGYFVNRAEGVRKSMRQAGDR